MTATFAGLLDDAAVFPPGNAPVPSAVREHRRHHQSWYAELIAPFVLSERHGISLAQRLTALSADRIARARESFVSFGTCSIADPVGDLVNLRLVEQC